MAKLVSQSTKNSIKLVLTSTFLRKYLHMSEICCIFAAEKQICYGTTRRITDHSNLSQLPVYRLIGLYPSVDG